MSSAHLLPPRSSVCRHHAVRRVYASSAGLSSSSAVLELILLAASVTVHAASVAMKLFAVALLLRVAVASAATCGDED